jgi:16S rRNA (cytidine1402-2'-O)-methyltransferase
LGKHGVLYLIPTIIADDTQHLVINPVTRDTIKNLRHFFTENSRTSRRHISALQLGLEIEKIEFCELTKDSALSDLKSFCDLLLQGTNIGVLSEAGCPGIADPGALVANWAHKNGIKVVPLPGPSSIILALMASGFSGQSFTFYGYLPINKNERIQMIRQMEKEANQFSRTQIFMETPYRNMKLLEDLLQICQPITKLCIACDITAPSEYIKTQTIQQWKLTKVDLNKKPTIFLIYN